MANAPGGPQGTLDAPPLASRAIAALSIATLVLAIAAELPSALANTSQWLTAHQAAVNAAVKQHGEAESAYQQAKTELEIARNADVRMKAEAEQAEAEAAKIEAEATTAQATARSSILKAKADADTAVAQADLNQQKALTELQNARMAAIDKRTEADAAEQNLKGVRLSLRQSVYVAGIIACPGNTYIAKIKAVEDGRCPGLRSLRDFPEK